MNTDTPKRSPPQPSDLEQKFHEAVRIVYLLTISRMAFTTERLRLTKAFPAQLALVGIH
jgi:hypothetical protein